jgi:cell division protein FtsB
MSTTSKKSAAHSPTPRDSVWVGVAFWLILFLATSLFAAVLLAPKWTRTELLDDRVAHLTAEVNRLNETHDRLGRLLEAFRHDPDFDRELARLELDYAQAGEQRLSEPAKAADLEAASNRATASRTEWWRPVVQIFAQDQSLRRAALATAAILLVVGLACFNSPRTQP